MKPEFVFHLAAQPILFESYKNPVDTIETNVVGTTNILDALRLLQEDCTAIIVTSDKCYENMEWEYGYREIDLLGGKDPYSASKVCKEILTNSFVQSYLKNSNIKNKIFN